MVTVDGVGERSVALVLEQREGIRMSGWDLPKPDPATSHALARGMVAVMDNDMLTPELEDR